MNCSRCGALLQEGTKVCDACGFEQPSPDVTQKTMYDTTYNQDNTQTPGVEKPAVKLGWFHFLIYFSLFAAALLQLANAFQLFTGFQYVRIGADAASVYLRFPDLKPLDYSFAVLYILDAVFIIATRFLLAKFKKSGPVCLYLCSVIALLFNVAYTVISSNIVGANVFDPSALGQLVGQNLALVVVLVINIIYFTKRKELFNK